MQNLTHRTQARGKKAMPINIDLACVRVKLRSALGLSTVEGLEVQKPSESTLE